MKSSKLAPVKKAATRPPAAPAPGKAGPTMAEVRAIARSRGLPIQRKSKQDLIRAIQAAEGNFDCFGSALEGVCDQDDCAWRQECLDRPGHAAVRPVRQ
jgi:hypothetical protein